MQEQAKAGILLVNLGTPDSPSTKDVRRYLKEFLSDPRVVEMPRILWWPVLNGIILNTRPKKSAAAYQKIWTEQGSPLLTITQTQGNLLQENLGDEFKVEIAMRYGNPSLADGLEKLQQAGCKRILIFPLYPQYSATTTGSTFDAITQQLRSWRHIPELRLVNQYFDNPDYIRALADSVKTHQQTHGKTEQLLISFHGLPKEYVDKGDPYADQCKRTASLLAEALDLQDSEWQLTFQSKVGPKEWLQPYTDQTLAELPSKGVKKVQIICPGFAADCLETLEEIAMENHDLFMHAGGEDYQYIPCLNDLPSHIDMLAQLAQRYTHGWNQQ